nr:DNA cytosine methyltransferase [Bacillus velezensis]
MGKTEGTGQKGYTFRSFVRALNRHGYKVEWKELKACDYGAPTIRKRLFLIARRDGRPIIWPSRRMAIQKRGSEVRKAKTVADCLRDYGLVTGNAVNFQQKKPLSENTMRRIARGIQRFVLNNPDPFIIKVNHSGDFLEDRNLISPYRL